jgi:hypothetical protein
VTGRAGGRFRIASKITAEVFAGERLPPGGHLVEHGAAARRRRCGVERLAARLLGDM